MELTAHRQEHSPRFLVVLTAAIRPSPGVRVERDDPAVRRADYESALAFWLNHVDPRLDRILFLENSGADLSSFEKMARDSNCRHKKVEFISTTLHRLPVGIHYGWCELKMLDEGLSRSSLVDETTHMIKATGRLTFPKISRLLDHISGECDAMVDCRIPTRSYQRGKTILPALRERREAYASTQLAIFSHAFYRHRLRGLADAMKPYSYPYDLMESAIYERLRVIGPSPGICLRFPRSCEPSGVGAERNRSYDSRSRKAAALVRACLRWTGLWI